MNADGVALAPPPAAAAAFAAHTRLSTMVAGHVAASLRLHAPQDRVTWEVGIQLVPTPVGPRPMVLVYLTTPSAVLGELIGEVVLLEPQQLAPANVDRNVAGAVERMREQRSKAASG